ncbi:hypothetical protein GCM10010832_03540 [Psychroflexus planctonicus]|uniref:Uncharacterized protein n=1 Tax=Psychroflexus planctonicus TaxID=1526575 RepID=A0ABQ1SFA6_9FLAO|nr:hypothetical protein GCM10010832_03540 [Psychroflexus planctonicus]
MEEDGIKSIGRHADGCVDEVQDRSKKVRKRLKTNFIAQIYYIAKQQNFFKTN